MNSKMMIAVIAAIVVVAAVGVSAVYILNGDNNSDETYYFYFAGTDNEKIDGWHSATGENAAVAFSNAMNKDNLKFEIGSSGYLSTVDNVSGYWFCAEYLYNSTSADAANGSVNSPSYSYDVLSYSNGWKQIAGYNSTEVTGDKLCELNGYVFFFSPYDSSYKAVKDPITDSTWKTTGPFEKETTLSTKEKTYYFYINGGTTYSSITGMYSAKGTDATTAFSNAMKAKNLEYGISSWGYLNKIGDAEGSFYSAMYTYNNMSKDAMKGSIDNPTESYGCLAVSNGWISTMGYNSDSVSGLKFCEFDSTLFYISMYAADYSAPGPVSDTNWMSSF